jgi:hypothetical protein
MSKLQNIIKWLYLNDKGFSDNKTWRKEFISMLESELEYTQEVHKSAEEFVKEEEVKTKPFTNIVKRGVKLPACNGKDFISEAKHTFKFWMDIDFKGCGLDVKGKSTKEQLLEVREITEDGTFKDIFSSLSEDLDKLVVTQSQIIRFCEKYPTLLRQEGYATFFLIKEDNEYFVVYVYVLSAGLNVNVYRLEYGLVWRGQHLRRVVFPQLVS